MGKNRREKREEEREGFAAKRTAQYRTRNLKALGILSGIGVIVAPKVQSSGDYPFGAQKIR